MFRYYMGRIHALQLDYTDAYTKLMQSSRKAPQNTAMGFQRSAQKLIIIVQVRSFFCGYFFCRVLAGVQTHACDAKFL